MPTLYYVNARAQSNGDHEVHRRGCRHMPDQRNAKYLGIFDSCGPAMVVARESFHQVNGCYFCSRNCHSSRE